MCFSLFTPSNKRVGIVLYVYTRSAPCLVRTITSVQINGLPFIIIRGNRLWQVQKRLMFLSTWHASQYCRMHSYIGTTIASNRAGKCLASAKRYCLSTVAKTRRKPSITGDLLAKTMTSAPPPATCACKNCHGVFTRAIRFRSLRICLA
jgi:hypothetical protein